MRKRRERKQNFQRTLLLRDKVWCLQQESNLHLHLRRESFYPLNYGGNRPYFKVLLAQHPHGFFQAFECERVHAVADDLLNDGNALAVFPHALWLGVDPRKFRECVNQAL